VGKVSSTKGEEVSHYFAQQEIGAKILASADSDGVLLNYFEGSEGEGNLKLTWAEVRELYSFLASAQNHKLRNGEPG
jgi:hypothetical protein